MHRACFPASYVLNEKPRGVAGFCAFFFVARAGFEPATFGL
jgi:hypothetical protein